MHKLHEPRSCDICSAEIANALRLSEEQLERLKERPQTRWGTVQIQAVEEQVTYLKEMQKKYA